MRLPNHIAGGFCLTGFFASVFFSVNVLASPVAIAAVVFGSIMPDCDNPRSLAGKIVYPIAKWLNRKVGHRTLTHSLVFIFCLALLSSTIEKTFFHSVEISIICVIAWFVHVLLDTFTVMGVQMMFPFSFEPYWMFDKMESKIRNGDFKAEGAFFLAFSVLIFAQGDLWKNGFWTSYNNELGTIDNLKSELHRSPDAIMVTAACKLGTEDVERKGMLVELKSSGMVLLNESGFVRVGDDEVFQHASFTHTGKQLGIRQQNIIGVTADSLNKILHGKHIKSIEVAANNSFQITEANGMQKQATNFKAAYISRTPVFSEQSHAPELDTFIADRTFLAEIDLIKAEIQRIEQANLQAESVQRKHRATIAQLRRDYSSTNDISERQRIQERIQELEKEKAPGTDGVKVESLKAKIRKIRKENSLRNEAKKREIERKNHQELAKAQETKFTGILSYITISQSNPKIQKNRIDSVKIIGIIDGDTVEIIDSNYQTNKVRLAHIDCPEKRQAFGKAAKKFASDFCYMKMGTVEVTDTDKYGRLVGIIRIGGKELNLALVQNGLAWHFKKYSKDQKYARAENLARDLKLGLWSQPAPTPPWQFRAEKHK